MAVPSWGVGTGGTRFARFPGPGEPRNVFEKLDDCAVDPAPRARARPRVSLHFPWDERDEPAELRGDAAARGLGFDAVNSNTFQDQPGQAHSYKFGSLTHTDAAVRAQAVEHNLDCIELGVTLGSRALTVWIGDGANFPGQQHFRRALERYLESLRAIYAALPDDWRMFIEHKLYEPAFYSTVHPGLGHQLLLRARARAEGRLPRRPRPPRAERQHRDDRRAADPARQARRASTSTTASTATTTSTPARSIRSSCS